MENAEIASPSNRVRILCVRERNICQMATANLELNMLNVETQDLEIVKWDRDNIEFINRTLIGCFDHQYLFSRVNERVNSSRLIAERNRSSGMCAQFDPKPIRLTLVDGFPVYWSLVEERRRATLPWLFLALGGWLFFTGQRAWFDLKR